ncbi:MAG TPA: hypothetical protein VGL23_18705 [Chloroflexota bacterium]|jgi:hypothetical protein
MKRLLYAAVGAALTLLSASPAFAQSADADMATALQNREAINSNLRDIAQQAAATSEPASADEAVLGVQALPAMGVEASMQVKLDMLTALRDFARKNRGLANVTAGGSTD